MVDNTLCCKIFNNIKPAETLWNKQLMWFEKKLDYSFILGCVDLFLSFETDSTEFYSVFLMKS